MKRPPGYFDPVKWQAELLKKCDDYCKQNDIEEEMGHFLLFCAIHHVCRGLFYGPPMSMGDDE